MNEDMRRAEKTATLLLENGYVIKNPEEFITVCGGLDLKSIIERLNALQAESAEPVNLELFNKNMVENLNQISEVLDNDLYFKNSMGAQEFLNTLNSFKNNFASALNYYRALDLVKKRRQVLVDIKNRISAISKDNTMDSALKTRETMKLAYGSSAARKDLIEAEHLRDSYKEEYDNSLNITDLISYKNNLLKNINALDDLFRHQQSMSPETKEALSLLIRNTRDSVVILDLARQQKETEFKELCQKYSLEYTGRLEKIDLTNGIDYIPDENSIDLTDEINYIPDENPIDLTDENEGTHIKSKIDFPDEEAPSEEPIDLSDTDPDEEKSKVIKSFYNENIYLHDIESDELEKEILDIRVFLDELRKANPGVTLELADEKFGSMYDNTIISSVAKEELILPENFYLDSKEEITNKNRTISGKYISVNIEQLEKEEENTINNLDELIHILQELNPAANIRLNSTVGIAEVDSDIKGEDLKLPEGFNYDAVIGVNNKKNDIDPCIAVHVKTREKNLNNDSSIKQTHPKAKNKVVLSRKAQVSELVAASIKSIGIGALALAYLPVGLVGAGLLGVGGRAGLHKLHEKIVDKMDQADKSKSVGLTIKEFGENFLNKIREIKSQAYPERTQALTDAQDVLEEQIPVLDQPEDIPVSQAPEQPTVYDVYREGLEAQMQGMGDVLGEEETLGGR